MTQKTRHPGGRPRKFHEPSHPVTVTLPDRTLNQLASIDHDRARAIVRVTDLALPHDVPPRRLIEVIEVSPGVGILVVPPSRFLKKIRLLRLAEIAPSRFLITIPSGTALAELEVALHDLADVIPEEEARERAIIQELLAMFRRLRRADQVSKAEIMLVAI
ncbi:MAG: hypothetical protein J5I99_01785 [Verrucomicrobia bacterium]|nr:hypothetical protein [Kiritimatiellia bacterium]MCO6399943.1 hypothetical protein [Verrucomicrobiota bacterium]